MGQKSGIPYVDASWGPWRGCTKVSPGCAHCYAEREMKKYGHDFSVVTRSKTTFEDPLKWKEPQIVFVCPWSDFFHPDADAWRPEAWEIMRLSERHFFLIPTKRSGRIADHLPSTWPLPNVGLGVSVEDNGYLWRIRDLGLIKATLRFVSLEPMLGPVLVGFFLDWLDWVILGGESGPGYRVFNDPWAFDVRDACNAANIPFYFKQHAGPRPGADPLLDRVGWRQRPHFLETWGNVGAWHTPPKG